MKMNGVIINRPTGIAAGATGQAPNLPHGKPANPYDVVQIPTFKKGGAGPSTGAVLNQNR